MRGAAAVVVAGAVVGTVAGVGATAPIGTAQEYVVTFDVAVDPDQVVRELEFVAGARVTERFGTSLAGAVITTDAVPEALDMVPGVATVDRNEVVSLPPVEEVPDEDPDPADTTTTTTSTTTTTVPEDDDPEPPDTTVPPTTVPPTTVPAGPPPPPWGVDRSDQRNLPLSSSYRAPASGTGVRAYIVDTGISPHSEFGDRLVTGADFIGGGTLDCQGHGTHVAGTVAGATLGLAPGATLVPVRALDCEGKGTVATVIEAFDWIIANHPAGTPGAVNFSIGGNPSSAEEAAVQRLLAAGLTLVTSAGNDSTDACAGATGTRTAGAIVVGATASDDRRADFSNTGPCVDLFAPGERIISASHRSPTDQTLKDGTSMAAPHVTGAAVVLLALDPWRSPIDVEAVLVGEATAGVVRDAGPGSPDRLLYSDPDRAAVAGVATPVAAPPAPAEVRPAVLAAPRTSTTQEAVLALTGADPRTFLVLGTLLLVAGAVAVALARRQQELAARTAAAAVAAAPPRLPIELVRAPRR